MPPICAKHDLLEPMCPRCSTAFVLGSSFRWTRGACTYGDSCKYSHGDQPDGQFGGGDDGGNRRQGNFGKRRGGERYDRDGPSRRGGQEHREKHGMFNSMDDADRGPNRGLLFKTQLCTRFMNTGDCPYGLSCKYAHGPEEMRQAPGQQMGMGPGNPMHMDMGPMGPLGGALLGGLGGNDGGPNGHDAHGLAKPGTGHGQPGFGDAKSGHGNAKPGYGNAESGPPSRGATATSRSPSRSPTRQSPATCSL
eukprot:jgi/Botrbrau1/13019/Bobra.0389s0015.4